MQTLLNYIITLSIGESKWIILPCYCPLLLLFICARKAAICNRYFHFYLSQTSYATESLKQGCSEFSLQKERYMTAKKLLSCAVWIKCFRFLLVLKQTCAHNVHSWPIRVHTQVKDLWFELNNKRLLWMSRRAWCSLAGVLQEFC